MHGTTNIKKVGFCLLINVPEELNFQISFGYDSLAIAGEKALVENQVARILGTRAFVDLSEINIMFKQGPRMTVHTLVCTPRFTAPVVIAPSQVSIAWQREATLGLKPT